MPSSHISINQGHGQHHKVINIAAAGDNFIIPECIHIEFEVSTNFQKWIVFNF